MCISTDDIPARSFQVGEEDSVIEVTENRSSER
jgi:hypothetical protein